MSASGKSINLFLMDGTASGRIKCTLASWTGVAYKIPRTALDLCKERDDLKQSGAFFFSEYLARQEKVLFTQREGNIEKILDYTDEILLSRGLELNDRESSYCEHADS